MGETYQCFPFFADGMLVDAELIRAVGIRDGGGAVFDFQVVYAFFGLYGVFGVLLQGKARFLCAIHSDNYGAACLSRQEQGKEKDGEGGK